MCLACSFSGNIRYRALIRDHLHPAWAKVSGEDKTRPSEPIPFRQLAIAIVMLLKEKGGNFLEVRRYQDEKGEDRKYFVEVSRGVAIEKAIQALRHQAKQDGIPTAFNFRQKRRASESKETDASAQKKARKIEPSDDKSHAAVEDVISSSLHSPSKLSKLDAGSPFSTASQEDTLGRILDQQRTVAVAYELQKRKLSLMDMVSPLERLRSQVASDRIARLELLRNQVTYGKMMTPSLLSSRAESALLPYSILSSVGRGELVNDLWRGASLRRSLDAAAAVSAANVGMLLDASSSSSRMLPMDVISRSSAAALAIVRPEGLTSSAAISLY